MQPKVRRHNTSYVIFICAIAALGGLLFGYDTAVISGAIGPLQDYFGLTAAEKGWAVSNVVVGCIFGALLGGLLANRYGRKSALIIAAILFTVSALGAALAPSFIVFVSFRIVGGLGVGIASVVSPMYMSEVSPKDMRGKAVGMQQFSIVFGQSVVFYVNYYIAKGMSPEWIIDLGWRWMIGSGVVPCILFLLTVFFIPESPRWNVSRQRDEKALATLAKISNMQHAQNLLKEIKNSLLQDKKNTVTSWSTLLQPGLFYILLVGCAIAALQQITGINAVMYYAPEILKSVAGSTEGALLQTTWIGLIFIFGNALGMYLIDKTGRRPLMFVGTIGCIVGLLICSWALYHQDKGYLALFGLLIYIVAFAISWGVACWTLIAEIFPNRIRATGMGIAVCCQWIAGFVVAQTFPMMSENATLTAYFHGAFPMWIFVACCLVCFWFIARFVPETKGVSLEQMEQHMLSHRHAATMTPSEQAASH